MCKDCSGPEGLEHARLASETARHYGTMRFAMFTVFTAVLGALMAFPFSQGGSAFIAQVGHRLLLAGGGFVLSMLFLLAEYRISTLVSFYQDAAVRAHGLTLPEDQGIWRDIVLFTMVAPYAMSAFFWLLVGFGAIGPLHAHPLRTCAAPLPGGVAAPAPPREAIPAMPHAGAKIALHNEIFTKQLDRVKK